MLASRLSIQSRRLSSGLLAGFAGIVIAAAPKMAPAGRFDTDRDDVRSAYRRDDDRREHRDDNCHRDDRDHRHGEIGFSVGGYRPAPPPVEERIWVPPVHRTVVDRIWVEPVYRTVIDRVWIEPVVRTIPDRKWVPDRHAWRDVIVHDCYGRRIVSREYVLVEPARFIDCTRDVVITPGRFEDRPRQELVCAGRWEIVERQELGL